MEFVTSWICASDRVPREGHAPLHSNMQIDLLANLKSISKSFADNLIRNG